MKNGTRKLTKAQQKRIKKINSVLREIYDTPEFWKMIKETLTHRKIGLLCAKGCKEHD